MQSLKNILTGPISPISKPRDKYLSRDFQELGLRLAEKLEDSAHKSLYIKLAKTHEAQLLESVLSFVSDSNARNKAALFMWKLKKLKEERKDKI